MQITLSNPFIKICLGLIVSMFMVTPALAQPGRTSCPDACTDSCEVDIACQNKLLFDKGANCLPFRCPGKGTETPIQVVNLNLFGITIRLNSEKAIQQIIVLAFSVFLGVVALAGVMIGVVAAIQRADTTDAAKIAKLTLTMRNAIVGVILVVMSMVFVQLVASFIGVGNIFSIVTFDNFIPNEGDFN